MPIPDTPDIRPPRLRLHHLILALAIVSALLALANVLSVSHRTQHDALVHNTLDTNLAYARKVADSADHHLDATMQSLAYSAQRLSQLWHVPGALEDEVEQLLRRHNAFNSSAVVSPDGLVLAFAPQSVGLLGQVLKSDEIRQSLAARKGFITSPYTGVTGRLLIFISQPVHADDGSYLGLVGGTLYLQQATNPLSTLLSEHHHQDGAHLYVVDSQQRLIHHPQRERIGQQVTGNPAIDRVLAGETGSMRLRNSLGVEMLAGYAPLKHAAWGVVVQRPVATTLAELDNLFLRTVARTVPWFAVHLLFIWWLSSVIVRPLNELAGHAQHPEQSRIAQIAGTTGTWYFEAWQLKHSLLSGATLINHKLERLNHESLTDPLTGLSNRRGMQSHLERWPADHPLSVITLDIDHFKTVNDTWGHATGDRVLQFLAEQLRENFRPDDILCRSGGEEFTLLLPGSPLPAAIQAAERLRERIAGLTSPTGQPITLSLGVAHFPSTADSIQQVQEHADAAMYAAKRAGRNRTVAADAEIPPA